jgi:hypothetical protein
LDDRSNAEPDAGPNCEQTSQFSDASLQIHGFGFACSQSVSFSLGDFAPLMTKFASPLARQFLASDKDSLEDLRIHQFKNNEEAHDDSAIDRLHEAFITDFEHVKSELSSVYGEPLRTGADHDDDIPLCGVFRFAIWSIESRLLYVAVAHEDRECPILLMIGVASR